MLTNLSEKWNARIEVAERSASQLRIARLAMLRDDIEDLIRSLVRAGYHVHLEVCIWRSLINKIISKGYN